MNYFFDHRRRHDLLAKPFPEAWLSYLDENVLLYRLLSDSDQAKLRDALRIFVAEKFWEGCAGLRVTDEMRVTVAGHACLLVLGFEDYYFDELKTVLLYPGSYLGVDKDPLGGKDELTHLLGQAHHHGPVILSWWHARWEGRRPGDTNLVLHEFAHKLAELGDPRLGMPPIEDVELAERWSKVVKAEYKRLVKAAEYERPTLLDPYGATNPAEFFAVASECFFLQSAALRQRHAALYQLLADWYRQDPAEWRRRDIISDQAKDAEREYTQHALAECSTTIRKFPDSVDAYRARAELFYDLGDFDSALADCTQVIRLAADEDKAEAYYERGSVHLASGEYEAAIEDMSAAIAREPGLAAAYRDRGSAHAARGERRQALADLNRALTLDAKDDAAWIERARLYADMGKHEKALRDLSRAIRLAPNVAAAYSERASVHLARKEYDQAIADCDAAVRLDPELPEAYKHRGVARYHTGEHDLAIADLGKAIELDPGYADAYRARADAYRAKGDEENARQDMEHHLKTRATPRPEV
jgi:Mlc titration factor MtfA (ptsG expression regulator)/lipoprotein NlpI